MNGVGEHTLLHRTAYRVDGPDVDGLAQRTVAEGEKMAS